MAFLTEKIIREALACAYLQGVNDMITDVLENNCRDYDKAACDYADARIAMLKGEST